MGDARPVLMQLIEEKLLAPGPKKLYVSYYRKRVYADLLTDGSIRFKDTIYISPVPCALQMKRTLNPSLKTDAGWSTMFSAASGESLKDIKDRLNIRKRGPNSRTVNKDKKLAGAASGLPVPGTKPATTATAGTSVTTESTKRLESTLQRCSGCKKEATTDYATCTACKRRTHFQCAHPVLEKAPSGSWFCDGCITDQADRILDFLNQTRRVLASQSKTDVVDVDEEAQTATDAESATEAEPEPALSSADTTGDKDEADAPVEGEVGKDESELNEKSVGPGEDSDLPSLGELAATTTPIEEKTVPPSDVRTTKLPAKERFVSLLEQLIEEVSSKSERTDIITNSTGASLVHLAKTDLVSLVERGLQEIEKATKKPASEEDVEEGTDGAIGGSNTFDMDELVKLFDLRHQVLQSKRQFEQTTDALVQRGEQRLRLAENDLMELEETRTTESNAVMKIANLIDQYTSDLKNCNERIRLNQVLLEGVMQRRKFIRSSNVSNVFLPAYRLIAKHMITSSDQLLVTVMLDKLRDVARMINEWEKMETHFETMSAKLQERLESMKIKKEQEDPGRAPSPVPLFARVKIPPSRRLLERQIANYKSNLKSIAANRTRIRRTLQTTLKIAKDELLGDEVIETTEILLRKCGGPIVVEEVEVPEKVEEIDDDNEQQSADGGEVSAEEKRTREEDAQEGSEPKRQRVEQPAVAEPEIVKPEPVRSSHPPVSLTSSLPQVSASISTPTPTISESSTMQQHVEAVDSEDSEGGRPGSSDESSPTPGYIAPSGSRQQAGFPPQMQTLESVRIKKELVEQATRNEGVSAAAGQHKEVTQGFNRQQTPDIQHVRNTPPPHGSNQASPWENHSPGIPRVEPPFRQSSPSLFQQVQQQQQQLQHQVNQRQQEQTQQKPQPSQARAQQQSSQQPGGRFPLPAHDLQHQSHQVAQQMQAEQQKSQRRETEQSRKNQRSQQQAREEVLRGPAQQEQPLPHAFQMPQSHPPQPTRPPQNQGPARAHQVSPVRDPFPQMASQPRQPQVQGFSALSEAHQPADFGRHHTGMPPAGVDPQPHGFQQQQQQQQQQFQRFQQQQQQQQQAGLLHGSNAGHRPGAGNNGAGHPLFGDMSKPPSMASGNIPTPQDLFGGHGQSQSPDEAMGLPPPGRPQPVPSRQTQQQQFQQQQQQMLHHSHHLGAPTSMGQHHTQSHPLASVGSMGSQFNDPTSMRPPNFLPPTNDARANNAGAFAYGDAAPNHMMHHPHNDVFGSHGMQQQQQQHQQPPSMHHLFPGDVGGRSNSADFQAHFNSRLFRDPTTDNQMNHPGMDGAPDMSEW